MSDSIAYDHTTIVGLLRAQITARLGGGAWEALVAGIGAPDIDDDPGRLSTQMRTFMRRFDEAADDGQARAILTRVRHGLTRDQFAWARERFARYRDIDAFNDACRAEQIELFTHLRDSGELFYGQPIDGRALEFVISQPGMLATVREGADLHVTGFPYDIAAYLRATDEREKRYHACHCPFARESIRQAEGEVSKTLCYCSLGHAKIMWEAIFEQDLDGDVAASALAGDPPCRYVIHLPAEIVERYT